MGEPRSIFMQVLWDRGAGTGIAATRIPAHYFKYSAMKRRLMFQVSCFGTTLEVYGFGVIL